MTYLVEIKSFEDLKAKYREWALKLHPDMGGTDAEMQVLNNEYDQLFPSLEEPERSSHRRNR